MNRYDFVIVGGGPVGCRAATELAKAGYQVVVLEKNSAVGQPVCCTGIISCECLRHFAIPEELVLKRFNRASVHTPCDTVLRIEREEIQAVAIDRGAFNAYMARQAQDHGADYLLGQYATGIQINPDGVQVYSKHNGITACFSARAVVLACGFASRLPSALGFGRARDWTVGAQVEVSPCDLDEVEVYLGSVLAPGYFAWLVPVGENRALAGLMADRQPHAHLAAFVALLRQKGRITGLIGNPSYRGITLRVPPRISAARVILIGDTSGQVKPLTGGGLFFGLLCADIGASTLCQAIAKDDFSSRSMRAYDKKCRDVLARELRLGWYGHRLFGKLSDERIDRLAHWAQRNNLPNRLSASQNIGFDWHGHAMLHLLKGMAWPFKKRSC